MHEFKAPNGDKHLFSDMRESCCRLKDFVCIHHLKIGDEEYQFIDLVGIVKRLDKRMQPVSENIFLDEGVARKIGELIVASVMNVVSAHLLDPNEENLKFIRSCENLLRYRGVTSEPEFVRLKFVFQMCSDLDRHVDLKFEKLDANFLHVKWTSAFNGEQKIFVLDTISNLNVWDRYLFYEMCEMLKRKLRFTRKQRKFDEITDETIKFLTERRDIWPTFYDIEREISLFLQESRQQKRKFEEV